MENKGPINASFIDNPAVKGREEKFISLTVSIPSILAGWKESLFAHEWLKADGSLKSLVELNDANREKRVAIESQLKSGTPLPKPVLGLGIMDNIEIGSGKDVLLTLASLSHDSLPVHIPKSHADDFKLFVR